MASCNHVVSRKIVNKCNQEYLALAGARFLFVCSLNRFFGIFTTNQLCKSSEFRTVSLR